MNDQKLDDKLARLAGNTVKFFENLHWAKMLQRSLLIVRGLAIYYVVGAVAAPVMLVFMALTLVKLT